MQGGIFSSTAKVRQPGKSIHSPSGIQQIVKATVADVDSIVTLRMCSRIL